MLSTSKSQAKSQTLAASQTDALASGASRFAPALFALLFGSFMILGVGFANSAAIHDAAHDGRHALSFPCH